MGWGALCEVGCGERWWILYSRGRGVGGWYVLSSIYSSGRETERRRCVVAWVGSSYIVAV